MSSLTLLETAAVAARVPLYAAATVSPALAVGSLLADHRRRDRAFQAR